MEYFITGASSSSRGRFLESMMPQIAKSVKNRLKTRCCFQVICFNTPPQEHGSLGVNAII